MKRTGPIYLDLLRFKWPWSAIVSGLHRISGLFLFFLIAPTVYLLNLSIQNEAGFNAARALFHSPLAWGILWLCLWGILHHLFSGLRFLLIDFDIGVTKENAQKSAKYITLSAGILAIIWTAGLLI